MKYENRNAKVNISLALILIVVILFCFTVWYLKVSINLKAFDLETTYSDCGTWDLSGFDFENEIIVTNGDTEYIKGELLSPKEFEERSDDVIKGMPKDDPVNTIKLTLLMPDDNTYMIMGNSNDYAEKLYVNGEFVKEIGKVGLTKETSAPGHSYLVFEVKPKDGVIEIIRQSNNFVHRDNGVGSNLLIGTPQLMNRQRNIDYGINGLVVGLLLALSISHMFLLDIFRENKSHLYFSILSLTWGLRIGVVGIKIFGSWFPNLPWEVMFRIEYLSGPVTSGMVLLIAEYIFPKKIPKIYLIICKSLFSIYALCCLFFPTIELSYSMIVFQIVYIGASVVLVGILIFETIKMVRRKEMQLEQYLFLIGFSLSVFAMVHDALYYNNIQLLGINIILNDLGMLIIVFTQSAAIFYNTARRTAQAYHSEYVSRTEAEALRQAGFMKEAFLRNLSHELQIPITVVSGFAQLTGQILEEDEKLDRKYIQDNMRVINDESRRLSRMVSQLLDASAMENGTFKLSCKKTYVEDLICEIENLHFPIMNDGSNELKLEIDENLPCVYIDEERILQVILNLLSNSIKYTRDGIIILSAKKNNEEVEISVEDNGEGIPSELLKDIFKQYPEHRSNKGNGLGLYIVGQTIEAHGGTVDIKSELGKGTIIKITLKECKEVAHSETN